MVILFRLGYKPFHLDSIFDADMYFAGTVERRVREMEEMFQRDEVKAIVCARGGYGCNHLLDRLSVDLIRQHPKIFVGYSDVSTLLTWMHDAAGLVTFHGPMITRDFDDSGDLLHAASWKNALEGREKWDVMAASEAHVDTVKPLVKGKAEGMLYGGCLSMLVGSIGTPYEIHTDGTILFIEDVNTRPFQIDRMLMQLKLAGKLKGVRGIVFGEMLHCAPERDHGYSLMDVFKRVVGDLGIPVAYGLRSGHVSRKNITLPFGVRALLHVEDTVRLTILEAATVKR